MTAERFSRLFLNHVPLLSPLRFQRLLEMAGSAETILSLSIPQLMAAEVDEPLARLWFETFRDLRLKRRAEADWQRAEKGEFRIVVETDPDYPASLRELSGRPPVLYVRGQWPLPPAWAMGLVGTR